jgi:hypothetical protein
MRLGRADAYGSLALRACPPNFNPTLGVAMVISLSLLVFYHREIGGLEGSQLPGCRSRIDPLPAERRDSCGPARGRSPASWKRSGRSGVPPQAQARLGEAHRQDLERRSRHMQGLRPAHENHRRHRLRARGRHRAHPSPPQSLAPPWSRLRKARGPPPEAQGAAQPRAQGSAPGPTETIDPVIDDELYSLDPIPPDDG